MLAAFVRLSRVKFLLGGFVGVALGTLVAAFERGRIDVRAYALAQLAVTAAHLMTQYANEYYDRESDARTVRTPFSGGSGVLVDGSLAPVVALRAAAVCLAAALVGLTLLVACGYGAAALVVLVIVPLAWAYSGPPVRLLARGWGEIDSAFVVAVLVPLCGYVAQTSALDTRAMLTMLPGAAAMFAMMLCVEIPDLAADAATGKRNLVVRFGVRTAGRLGLWTLGAVCAAIISAVIFGAPPAFGLLECIALAPIVSLGRAFARLRRGEAVAPGELAARGVALFLSVGVLGVLGYASALRLS